jgi:hypothetical protein
MPDPAFHVEILSNAANVCKVAFDDPKMALAWIQVIAHAITPPQFVDIVKSLYPGDDHLIEIVTEGVKHCVTRDSA